MRSVRRPTRFALRCRRLAPSRQRGAVALVVALTLSVLLGAVGLALDSGHLYLTRTELQNSADACALAASYELEATDPEAEVYD